MRRATPTLLALTLALPAVAAAADGPSFPTLAIGAKAPDFDLPGVDGKRYTLASFDKAKVLVLVFTANHCPTAQAYEDRIEKLDADYAGRGVQLVLVAPNDPSRCASTSRAGRTSGTPSTR
jgi:cytochrome oxidase Cu insertion factor (SCO1/SenC/PrrC family)